MLRRRALLHSLILTSAIFATTPALGQTGGTVSGDCSKYSSIPLPNEAELCSPPKESPACASYRSYRGIGRPVNYAQALACAWQERSAQKADLAQNPKEPLAWVVGGSLILADIYINGAGVERNVPLAMRFACESEEGMASLAAEAIAKTQRASRPYPAPFEFCHYAASTLAMNFCAAYSSEIEDDRRSRYYASLRRSMTPEQAAAFDKLLAAEKAYVEIHASEVDQGGTIRGLRTIGSQQILKRLFHSEMVQFERKQWPALSQTQLKSADTLLRLEYEKKLEKLHSHTKEYVEQGAVSAEDLTRVEEAWERYRDAWTTFAERRSPTAGTRARAAVTLDRYRLLKTIE